MYTHVPSPCGCWNPGCLLSHGGRSFLLVGTGVYGQSSIQLRGIFQAQEIQETEKRRQNLCRHNACDRLVEVFQCRTNSVIPTWMRKAWKSGMLVDKASQAFNIINRLCVSEFSVAPINRPTRTHRISKASSLLYPSSVL
eukprot:jgi/Botrbrau1/9725/Bobra.0388s0018.1